MKKIIMTYSKDMMKLQSGRAGAWGLEAMKRLGLASSSAKPLTLLSRTQRPRVLKVHSAYGQECL